MDIGEYEALLGGLSPAWQNALTNKNIAYPLNSYRFDPALNFLFSNDTSFGSDHMAGGAHFLYADSSVRFVSDSVELDLLKSLASREQGDHCELGYSPPAAASIVAPQVGGRIVARLAAINAAATLRPCRASLDSTANR